MSDNARSDDPRTAAPAPPFRGDQQQEPPGDSQKMEPRPDHGEASYQGKGLLRDKVALITGADSGIGRAVAIAFAREGADVAIAYLNEDDDAQESARLVTEAGRSALLLKGDLSGRQHCLDVVDATVRRFGKIDILVNNAAVQPMHRSLDEIRPEDVERAFRTNVFAMFDLCQAAVPHMKPGSAIVNTTSVNAKMPQPEMLVYATTKGAIATFTVGLAKLLAARGIRVNCVAPGPVWTPLQPSTKTPDELERLGGDTPSGRPGQPAEVAPVYVLLASDEGRYMTGALVPVTGGLGML